jgi:tetratricopeptide (TPR) repeat protein
MRTCRFRRTARRASRWALGFALAAGCALGPWPARADEASTERAREQFRRGVALFEKGDFVGALEAFEGSDRERHAPPITYNIARAREALGRAQSALDAYEEYLAEAGEQGEYTSAATLAVAQIKARSSRVRVESEPAGVAVRVDGALLAERTPVTVLLFRGLHRVSVEAQGWNEGRDHVAAGGGASETLRFVRPPAGAGERAAGTKDSRVVAAGAPSADRPAGDAPVLDGMTGGVGVCFTYLAFVNRAEEQTPTETNSADAKAKGLVFGLTLEVGYALGRSTALMLRGFGGLGSAEKEVASLGAAGLVASTRLGPRGWVGGGALLGVGRSSSDATATSIVGAQRDSTIAYHTDLAVGPMLELGYALGQNEDGQWIVSALPGLLLSTGPSQSTLVVPIAFGHRWF